MAKKCLKCEFPDNPDDAHYCGECGEPLDKKYSWGVMARYSLIEEDRLDYLENINREYKALEQKYDRTLEARLHDWWVRFDYWWEVTGQPLMSILILVIGIVFAAYYFYLAFTS